MMANPTDEDERTPLIFPPSQPNLHTVTSTESEQHLHRNSTASLRRHSSAQLPPFHEDHEPSLEPRSKLAIWTVVPVCLLGVFIGNADGSLVVVSSQQIASEFDALSDASWLVTSYMLAMCASQPLYGKLSDIFGRKGILAVAYTFFAVGTFLCGAGTTFGSVLTGRAVSGIGGAGMTALVSIIIADMVPVREVASWRSYVNVAATTGRALGGPVGGVLVDSIGWRWCFYGQVPITVLGLLLILWKLPAPSPSHGTDNKSSSFASQLRRIDVLGALLLIVTITSFLLTLDFATGGLPVGYPLASAAMSFVSGVGLYFVERSWAKEPILPLEILGRRALVSSGLVGGLQMAAQFSMFYSVPLYFQIVTGVRAGNAGLRLVPAVVGNATAGLLAGYIINKTGRYKPFTVIATGIGSLAYLIIVIRWRGHTSWAETLYFYFGGFASGATQSTTFIHLAASLDHSEFAIAGTVLYVAQNVFVITGISASTAVLQLRLRALLDTRLEGYKHKSKIIKSAISSVQNIRKLPADIRQVVNGAYIDSLSWAFGLSVVLAVPACLIAMAWRERKL